MASVLVLGIKGTGSNPVTPIYIYFKINNIFIMSLITLSLNIPAQNAKMSSDFIPIIGQHGINLKQFCDEFNKMTIDIFEDVLLKVKVYINPNKTFIIKINGVNSSFILKYYINKNSKSISILDFYNIIMCNYNINKIFGNEIDLNTLIMDLNYKLKIYNLIIKD